MDALPRKREILATWPGPVTWILPARPGIPSWLRGNNQGLAVRISNHPEVRELCENAGILVSTSANPAGSKPARDVRRVRAYFGDSLDYILPGRVGNLAGPTEIRDAVSGKILRSNR
jgi:L-threonylcarbamoyladenylate synthase